MFNSHRICSDQNTINSLNNKKFSREEERIKSFVAWQVQYPVDPVRLAKAGFYYTGIDDEVECFSCKGRISNWNYGDVVLKKHSELFPNCDFVNNRSNNVPIVQSRQPHANEDSNRTSFNFNHSPQMSRTFNYDKMKSLKERMHTFKNWPVMNINVSKLAHSGFFYLGIEDKVQCPFCRGILSNWEINDDPMTEHAKHFPMCDFLPRQSSDSGSTDISWFNVGAEDVCGNAQKQIKSAPKCKLLQEGTGQMDLKKLGVNCHSEPAHPHQSTYGARLRTFSRWPETLPVSKEDLAKAGFFYIGINDHTKCFHCDGGLCDWVEGDNPWIEHARWFRKCGFLQLNKDAFAESCFKEKPSKKIETRVPRTLVFSIQVDSLTVLSQVDDAMKSDLVKQVLETHIFPSYVIRAAILKQLQETGSLFSTVDQLCVAANYLKEQMENKLETKTDRLALKPETIGIKPSAYTEGSAVREIEISENTLKESTSVRLQGVDKPSDDDRKIPPDHCLCKICMDTEVRVVFLPCGHLLACTECASALNACPMCRKPIQATVRAYLP